MLGSTFISTQSPKELVGIDLENLEAFKHTALDELLTLDFEAALQGTGIKWTEGDPVFYEPEDGIAILRVNPNALENILSAQSSLAQSHPDDISALRAFVAENGSGHIYELATF
jgi:hypothetical protein